ncbi:hypothetical protein D3C87_1820050 [compost metagenome]
MLSAVSELLHHGRPYIQQYEEWNPDYEDPQSHQAGVKRGLLPSPLLSQEYLPLPHTRTAPLEQLRLGAADPAPFDPASAYPHAEPRSHSSWLQQ